MKRKYSCFGGRVLIALRVQHVCFPEASAGPRTLAA